jgi:hypothetical protein
VPIDEQELRQRLRAVAAQASPPRFSVESLVSRIRRRHARIMAAIAGSFLAVAAIAVAVPIGLSAPSPPPRVSASAPGNLTALAQVARSVSCRATKRQAVGVPVPARFVAVAAIQCIPSDQVVPGRGLWQFELRQVADHGLARLTAALRRPSATPPRSLLCAAYGMSVPLFALLGSDGRMIYPHVPTDECGHPQEQVLAALGALHWVTVSAQRGRQIETQAVIESGCPAGWKDMIGFLSGLARDQSPRPSPGGRVFSPRPSWLRVCVYRDRSGPLDTVFVGGGRISGTAETALLAGIAAGRDSAACARAHTMFAVVVPPQIGAMPAYVEIGGCQRVLRPDNRIGQASPAALVIINQARR